jgi:hypothetical protein
MTSDPGSHAAINASESSIYSSTINGLPIINIETTGIFFDLINLIILGKNEKTNYWLDYCCICIDMGHIKMDRFS